MLTIKEKIRKGSTNSFGYIKIKTSHKNGRNRYIKIGTIKIGTIKNKCIRCRQFGIKLERGRQIRYKVNLTFSQKRTKKYLTLGFFPINF